MVNIINNRTVRKIILIVLSALIALICLFLVFHGKNNSNEFQDPEVLEKISKVLHGQNEISEATLIAARTVSHLAKNNYSAYIVCYINGWLDEFFTKKYYE